VAEITTTGALKRLEQSGGIAHHAKVHVARRPRALEAQLERDASFDDDASSSSSKTRAMDRANSGTIPT